MNEDTDGVFLAELRFQNHLAETRQLNTPMIVVPDHLLEELINASGMAMCRCSDLSYTVQGGQMMWKGVPIYTLSDVARLIENPGCSKSITNRDHDERAAIKKEYNDALKRMTEYLKETSQTNKENAFVDDKLLSRLKESSYRYAKMFISVDAAYALLNGRHKYMGARLYGRDEAKKAVDDLGVIVKNFDVEYLKNVKNCPGVKK